MKIQGIFVALMAATVLCIHSASYAAGPTASAIPAPPPPPPPAAPLADPPLDYQEQLRRKGVDDLHLDGRLSPEEIRALAKKGDPGGQFFYGDALEYGRNETVNYPEAIKWFKLAAGQHYLPAIKRLASIYRDGGHAPADLVMSIQYYREAAEAGDAESQFQLGTIYNDPAVFKSKMPADLFEAEKWYKKALAQGFYFAKYNLMQVYLSIDPAKAVVMLKDLMHGDETSPIYPNVIDDLAECYFRGRGVAKDSAEALRLTELAAGMGNVWSQYRLGSMYYDGNGVAQDDVLAYSWLRIAAEAGNASAKENYESVKDQITPAQRPLIDAKVVELKARGAETIKQRNRKYAAQMRRNGIVWTPPQ